MTQPSPRPPFLYCPWCKGDLSRENPYRQTCASCGFILYHTSSPCVGALPLDAQGNVLLARRGIHPYFGDWNIVGGFLNYQEDPIEGLIREVHEETGVRCVVDRFVTMTADVYGDNGQALLNAYFTVKLLSDDVRPHDDVSELRWFPLDALPDNLPFASDRKALAALRAMRSAGGIAVGMTSAINE